jgi:hypothetical protein
MCSHKSIRQPARSSLARSTHGAAANEYVILMTLLAVAGGGGFMALGFSMSDAIGGSGGGSSMAASMGRAGAGPGAAPLTAQAGVREDNIEDLRDKGLEDTDIDELEALGVDLEHVMDYSREDFEAFGVDPGVIDKIVEVQAGAGTPAPAEDPATDDAPPSLDDSELPDPSDINPDDLLAGTGAEFSIDELDPNAEIAEKCFGIEDPRARYACLASENGIEPPPSYEMGGTGCFGAEIGTCLKDGWHTFAGAFGDSMKGIWNFISHPADAAGALWAAVRNPVGTVKSVWNYYKDACTTDGYTCAGTISADLVFSLGTGFAGRFLHGAKMGMVRKVPTLGNVPGFRLAGRRMAFGPFTQDAFHKGHVAVKNGSRFEGIFKRLEATWDIHKVMPGNGTPLSRFRGARTLLNEEGVVARHMAHQARAGRATLTTGHFDEFFRSGDTFEMGALDSMAKSKASKSFDSFVAREPMTRADRALREVARNADGTFTLSDKIDTFSVGDEGITISLKATDKSAAALDKFRGNGLKITREGDAFSVTMPQEFRSPSWGGWNTTPWVDAIGMGVPVGLTGSFVRHAHEQEQLRKFYEAAAAQQGQ